MLRPVTGLKPMPRPTAPTSGGSPSLAKPLAGDSPSASAADSPSPTNGVKSRSSSADSKAEASASARLDHLTNVDDGGDDTSELLWKFLVLEEGNLLWEDRHSARLLLAHGEWGMALSGLQTCVAARPEVFSPEGHRLLAAAEKAMLID
jgi:hypothetical protein